MILRNRARAPARNRISTKKIYSITITSTSMSTKVDGV